MPTNTQPIVLGAVEIETAFQAELTRLLALSLSPEQEEIARRYYSQKERDSMDSSDFCGPHKSFPVKSQEDVTNAAGLAGHADNPDAVRACIKSKAKAHGWKLPDSWTKDDSDRVETPVIVRANGNHDVMSGTHSHAHPANDSQGGDETHSHEHSHDGDASHGHSHAEDRAAMPTEVRLYFPIVDISRGDPDKWEVEGVATSEEIDSFGTIFSYEGSKHAFQKWAERVANVREMHEKKAVGKGIGVRFNDEKKKIHLRTRVSRGARDTWLKVEDGVLDGYSVGAINPVWDTIERNGKKYPYLVSYDLAEVSLVDNASNPDGQGLTLCRANSLTEVVEVSEQETETPSMADITIALDRNRLIQAVGAEVERAGARISGATSSKMHESIAHTLQAAKSQMQNCGCQNCQDAIKALDPDNDDDIDAFGGKYGDTDGDADGLYGDDGDGDEEERMTRILTTIMEPVNTRITTALAAISQRSNAVLARMAGQPDTPIFDAELIRSALSAEIHTQTTTALQEQLSSVTTALERLATTSSLDEVRSLVNEVKGQVDRIAAQPAPGGPVLNGGAYPVDKRLANQPYAQAQQNVATFWDWAQREGLLTTPELQMRAATAAVIPLQGRR